MCQSAVLLQIGSRLVLARLSLTEPTSFTAARPSRADKSRDPALSSHDLLEPDATGPDVVVVIGELAYPDFRNLGVAKMLSH